MPDRSTNPAPAPASDATASLVSLPAFAGAAFLLLGWVFAAQAADVKAQVAGADMRVPTVTVVQARTTEVVARVPVSGTLVAREEVLINPQITGYAIEQINVDIGDQVKVGDVLVVLNDSTLKAQLVQAESELLRARASVRQAQSQIDSTKAAMDQADAALGRAEQLGESGNVSQATLDQSRSAALSARAAFASAGDGLQVAEAQVVQAGSQRDLAVLNLARAEIRTPVAGVISARNVKLGAIATAGAEPMFRMIRDGEIELEAEVIESALGTISVGDRAEMAVAGNGTLDGEVRLIYPVVDPATRLGVVKISLPDREALRSGLFAGGWIVTAKRDAVTVPSAAVLTDAYGAYVLGVEGDTIIRKNVVAGLIWRNRREIVSGLANGETVVAKAGAFFADGDRIKPLAETGSGDGAAQGATQ